MKLLSDNSLMSADEQGVVIMWNYETGEELRRFSQRHESFLELPHGFFCFGLVDGWILFKHLSDDAFEVKIKSHDDRVKCMQIIDNNRLLSSSSDYQINILRLEFN